MDFQKLLFDVGNALSKDEVKALAFLCTDILNRNLASVESAGDLFSRLGDQNHLSAERPDLLTELLLIIKRYKLISDLKLSDGASTSSSLVSPYRKLLYNLSEEITEENLEHSTLEVFLEMEHMGRISDTNLKLLEEIFDKVCPMLKVKIDRFKALQGKRREQ
ncbi:Caspase-8 [Liparis tanakae]|uniref:Caspase-8 n=1 Tax=Liparis tanakae TaxID=230148 RepID=A0A4Z2E306_9TELE|nr:Caspase-8 [Liparis tanakae]